MNKKLKVVLDTNVFLVSLASSFKYHWIFQNLIQGNFEICVSNEMLIEYQEVIVQRYGLARTDATLDFLLLLPNVIQITPHFHWNLIENDKDDNKFVDCAVAGNVDFIVSNDKDFNILAGIDFPPLKVLTADQFEELYKKEIQKRSSRP